MTFDEFEAVCSSWQQMNEGLAREAWEQTRLLAAICIQPYVKKKITPRQLVPLPWDNENLQKTDEPPLSPEERLERFKRLACQ